MSVSVLCAPALAVNLDCAATVEEPKIREEYASSTGRKSSDDLVNEISHFISDIVAPYYTGINKTSIQVADDVGIHKYAGAMVVCDALQSVYHVSTDYQQGALAVNGVMYTISNDRKPIVAGMLYTGDTGHMVVINGWTLVGSQIAVVFMDPMAGSTIATISYEGPISLPLGGNMYTMQEFLI